MKDIPGKLLHKKFEDFSTSRNLVCAGVHAQHARWRFLLPDTRNTCARDS